jgi:hypothetical protein
MGRSVSSETLERLAAADPTQLGVQLAKVVVDANLPLSYISLALGMSRMTVYNWSRGRMVSGKHYPRVQALIDILREDLASGLLPVTRPTAAAEYVRENLGVTIVSRRTKAQMQAEASPPPEEVEADSTSVV